MRNLLLIPLLIFCLHAHAQCTHDDAPAHLAFKTGAIADDDAVWNIPLVVHVLYNTEADSIPADVIRAMILDSLNADYRRTNWDTIYTQTAFRPIAVDTRVQFQFVATDPDGNATEGITYRQTDAQQFNWLEKEMMYDSLGGRDPWDVCSTINLYVCRYTGGKQFAESTNPWNETDRIGLTAIPNVFHANPNIRLSRHITHFFGHFMGMRDYHHSNQCSDVDGIEDTPIQRNPPIIDLLNPDSIYAETTCDSLPNGRLGCNFMLITYPNMLHRMNMFTQGQKAYMREATLFYNPGLVYANACWPAAVAEVAPTTALRLWPNPTAAQLQFETQTAAPYSITDMLGRPVQRGQTVAGQNQIAVDALLDGIYLLRLDGAVAGARFVKTHQ